MLHKQTQNYPEFSIELLKYTADVSHRPQIIQSIYCHGVILHTQEYK